MAARKNPVTVSYLTSDFNGMTMLSSPDKKLWWAKLSVAKGYRAIMGDEKVYIKPSIKAWFDSLNLSADTLLSLMNTKDQQMAGLIERTKEAPVSRNKKPVKSGSRRSNTATTSNSEITEVLNGLTSVLAKLLEKMN